jgi:Asp-tRNA(Asn)/Glu-tRNA(Gln) amidotransferase B subunit
LVKIKFQFFLIKFIKFRKRFDLTAHSHHEIIKLFEYLQKLLINRNVLTFPRCYLRSDLDKHLQIEIKQIIEKHHGTIVDNEEDADHIVYSVLNENLKNIQNERESRTKKIKLFCFNKVLFV